VAADTAVRRIGDLVLTEREFAVPLDHAQPDDASIIVFAREVASRDGLERPLLVYFEGGPGMEARRPNVTPLEPSWLERALRDYRVLFLDQRGTGRSTPVGSLPDMTPAEQAAYLSIAPEGLREAFTTGGLPPVGVHVDEVYRHTYPRVLERNRRFYARYPDDRARVTEVERRIAAGAVTLPSGDVLTVRRFRQLGPLFGMADGFERVHAILERPPDSPAFLCDVEAALAFSRNPIFAILHEASYADGCVTGWSAERMRPPEFDDDPELFTGEHVFPWMFEDYGALRPLQEASKQLAEHERPRLFDPGRLARNEVAASSIVYADDMYVERTLSEATAASIRGLRTWVTNEYEHDGLRVDGGRILDRLITLARSA
jgi:pimeloyl-ACP methyl ester carboxylesterase